jgi:hypothetical protein
MLAAFLLLPSLILASAAPADPVPQSDPQTVAGIFCKSIDGIIGLNNYLADNPDLPDAMAALSGYNGGGDECSYLERIPVTDPQMLQLFVCNDGVAMMAFSLAEGESKIYGAVVVDMQFDSGGEPDAPPGGTGIQSVPIGGA